MEHLKAQGGDRGEETLPPLYTFEEHARRFGHLGPGERLAAFFALPAWEQAEAYLSCRQEIDRFRADDLDGSAEQTEWGMAA